MLRRSFHQQSTSWKTPEPIKKPLQFSGTPLATCSARGSHSARVSGMPRVGETATATGDQGAGSGIFRVETWVNRDTPG